MSGPLDGLKVLEMAGMGPGPFAGMLLADMGAEVLRVDRIARSDEKPFDFLLRRGRRSIAVDLRHPEGAAVVRDLAERADVLIEGFRPGVMERLGLGPDQCMERNPRLIYGRMTGWGQSGPNAQQPGHDINFIAAAGILSAIGRPGQAPVPPLNVVGDFGGGGMLLAFGVMCAVFEAQRSGRGQVVDAAMIDGAALLGTVFHSVNAVGGWDHRRGGNIVDGGAYFYDSYETSDGKYMSVGAAEPQFLREAARLLGLNPDQLPDPADKSRWPEGKALFSAAFKTRTQAQWTAVFAGQDTCVTPVLGLIEATTYPHNVARATFVEHGGVKQPAPAPRFSRTAATLGRLPPKAGRDTDEALADWGIERERIAVLRAAGAIG